jgi:hypothetical protein
MLHLGAEKTGCYRVIRVTGNLDGPVIFHCHQHAAGVRAVKGAYGTFGHSNLFMMSC